MFIYTLIYIPKKLHGLQQYLPVNLFRLDPYTKYKHVFQLILLYVYALFILSVTIIVEKNISEK